MILETIASKSPDVERKNLQITKLFLALISQSKKVFEGGNRPSNRPLVTCNSGRIKTRSFTIDRSFNSIIFAGSWVKEKSQFWPHLANLMNSLQTKSEVHRLSSAQIAQLKTYPLKDGNDAVGDSHHKRSVEIIECI